MSSLSLSLSPSAAYHRALLWCSSATNSYYTRNYYMLYGGHYYYCYSCGRQATRPTCDPDVCSCDEGSECDPVDPNSMTMTVPAVTGSATIMLNPRVWSYETSNLESGVAFNFSKAFAADLSASLGVRAHSACPCSPASHLAAS